MGMAKAILISDDSKISITAKSDDKIDKYCLARAVVKSIKAYDAAFKNPYDKELKFLVLELLNE